MNELRFLDPAAVFLLRFYCPVQQHTKFKYKQKRLLSAFHKKKMYCLVKVENILKKDFRCL